MIRATVIFCGLFSSVCALSADRLPNTLLPNIMLIVADDLGYSDIGVFGSDIRTPNIDALAAQGVVFTQFHTASSCAPTRAMLLSGNNNHVAGIGRQGIHSGRITEGLRGYEGHLSDRVAILPAVLRDAGYRTYMAGKWHLGYEEEYPPTRYGFEKAFNLNGGAASHFDETGFAEGGSVYYEHGVRVKYPIGRYTTEVYTDKLIQYLDEHGDDPSPFFLYAAYTSPHWPLQVPDEDLDLYAGKFEMGYDEYRKQRFAALKQSGVIPHDQALPPRNAAIPHWEDLTVDEKRRESRKMELYAAMVDNLDRHIGRLVAHLKKIGKYEDTLIIFMSDNGADGVDFYARGRYKEYIQAHYNIDYENMGKRSSFITYDAPWAEAGSAPFRLYKMYAAEGGITAPMIIAGPGVKRIGETSHEYVTVADIAPTLYQLADADYPTEAAPMTGASMASFLEKENDSVHDENYVTTYFHANNAYLRQGDWKLLNVEVPFDESGFGLYNLAEDPAETTDLRVSHPEKYTDLIELWRTERKRLGIILPKDL